VTTSLALGSDAARLHAVADAVASLGAGLVEPTELAGLVVRDIGRLVGDGAGIWLTALGGDQVARSGRLPDRLPAELLDLIRSPGGPGHGCGGRVHGGCLPQLAASGLAAVAVLPVRARGRAVGTLVVTRTSAHPDFAEEDLRFAQTLADIVGVTVERATLVEDATVAYEELRRQSELVDHVSDAIISVDLDHRVVSWNVAAERIYGYSAGEAAGCDLFALLATRLLSTDGGPAELAAVIAETIHTGQWRGELRERSAHGTELQLLASFAALVDDAGEPAGFVIVNRDMTEQRRKEHQATHDTLTGLANRARAADGLRRALGRAAGDGSTLAVLFLDLDGFKQVNDQLGHEAGDEVLRVTAARLAGAVRRNDLLARLGGDEFMVVAEDVGDTGAAILGRRLLAATSAPIVIGDAAVTVLPSIGIALSRGGRDDPDELVRVADAAMYRAKQSRDGMAFAS
jgi:diguanylate cyclase (GGDEF)-like protein/PAS domain S-box-containing protein